MMVRVTNIIHGAGKLEKNDVMQGEGQTKTTGIPISL